MRYAVLTAAVVLGACHDDVTALNPIGEYDIVSIDCAGCEAETLYTKLSIVEDHGQIYVVLWKPNSSKVVNVYGDYDGLRTVHVTETMTVTSGQFAVTVGNFEIVRDEAGITGSGPMSWGGRFELVAVPAR